MDKAVKAADFAPTIATLLGLDTSRYQGDVIARISETAAPDA